MASATITVDSRTTLGALDRLYAAAGDLKPALKNIGEEVLAGSARDRFVSETDPQGRPWPDLNPLYALTKKGPGKLKGESRQLSQIDWQLDGETAVDAGSNLIYARIHNEGGVIKPKTAAALVFSMGGQTFKVKSVTIPKRQFLGISDSDMQTILAIIEDHFEMAMGESAS